MDNYNNICILQSMLQKTMPSICFKNLLYMLKMDAATNCLLYCVHIPRQLIYVDHVAQQSITFLLFIFPMLTTVYPILLLFCSSVCFIIAVFQNGANAMMIKDNSVLLKLTYSIFKTIQAETRKNYNKKKYLQ